jgi:mannose-6-phosphate isomerase-like protein (cupin superfamily)
MQVYKVTPDWALTETDSMRCRMMTWPPEFECEYHSHDGADELFLFLEGKARVRAGDEVQEIAANHFVYVPRDVPHKIKNIGPDDLVIFAVVAPNRVPTHTTHPDPDK